MWGRLPFVTPKTLLVHPTCLCRLSCQGRASAAANDLSLLRIAGNPISYPSSLCPQEHTTHGQERVFQRGLRRPPGYREQVCRLSRYLRSGPQDQFGGPERRGATAQSLCRGRDRVLGSPLSPAGCGSELVSALPEIASPNGLAAPGPGFARRECGKWHALCDSHSRQKGSLNSQANTQAEVFHYRWNFDNHQIRYSCELAAPFASQSTRQKGSRSLTGSPSVWCG